MILKEKTGPDRLVTCHAGSLSPMSVPQESPKRFEPPQPHDMEPQQSGRCLQILVLSHHIPCSLDMKGGFFWLSCLSELQMHNFIQGRAWLTSYPSKHSGQHSPLHETKGLSSSPNQPRSRQSQRRGERQPQLSLASTIKEVSKVRNRIWDEVAKPHLLSTVPQACGLPPVWCCDQRDLLKPQGER